MYCMNPTISCCESQNYRDNEKTMAARDDGEGGRTGGAQRSLRAVRLLCRTL